MEKYLIEEYNIFEDKNYLTNEDEIKDYFSDNGREFFDCGQGYYQDKVEALCKVGDRFYEVGIEAEIGSAKQDVGDRLYWVERISSVNYKEVDKPGPKSREKVQYNLMLTSHQRDLLESFMKENYIEF